MTDTKESMNKEELHESGNSIAAVCKNCGKIEASGAIAKKGELCTLKIFCIY